METPVTVQGDPPLAGCAAPAQPGRVWVSDDRSVPMTGQVIPEHDVLSEAAEVLVPHLSPAKVARFWAAWQGGGGSDLAMRDHLCAGETVTTLFENVRTYQEDRQEP